jgi:hypothetical protein
LQGACEQPATYSQAPDVVAHPLQDEGLLHRAAAAVGLASDKAQETKEAAKDQASKGCVKHHRLACLSERAMLRVNAMGLQHEHTRHVVLGFELMLCRATATYGSIVTLERC